MLGPASYGLGFVAGTLSTLSPCVLPIVPILLGSATLAHPRAPLALAGGLALSYGVFGTLLAWASSALDADTGWFRIAGALLLGAFGVILLSERLQQWLAARTAGLGRSGDAWLNRLQVGGLGGQFLVGLALGLVWTPCVGPTLGAAVVLASQGTQLPQVALLMMLFGLGAALPVVGLSYASRAATAHIRNTLLRIGHWGKPALGVVLLAVATLALSGGDKVLEAWLLDRIPAGWTALTTRV